jgi:hypothetical protein
MKLAWLLVGLVLCVAGFLLQLNRQFKSNDPSNDSLRRVLDALSMVFYVAGTLVTVASLAAWWVYKRDTLSCDIDGSRCDSAASKNGAPEL